MAEARDWVYLRVPLHGDDGADAGDRVLRDVVGPAVGRLRARAWFFLRFRDPTGLHLRLRVAAEPERLGAVRAELAGALAADGLEHTEAFYSPETGKFGTGAAMRAAEDAFTAGSELALELARAGVGRVPAAAAVMSDLVGTLPPDRRAGFLHQYAWYWSGGPVADRPVRPVAALLADPGARDRLASVRNGAGRLRAHERCGPALARFVRRVAAVPPDGSSAPRQAAVRLFHHLHLTSNRLGVFPGAEAGLARLLWLAESRTAHRLDQREVTNVSSATVHNPCPTGARGPVRALPPTLGSNHVG